MLTQSDYNYLGESTGGEPLNTASGMAISGTYIFNALDIENRDAIENEA